MQRTNYYYTTERGTVNSSGPVTELHRVEKMGDRAAAHRVRILLPGVEEQKHVAGEIVVWCKIILVSDFGASVIFLEPADFCPDGLVFGVNIFVLK